ncbi:uncharacterized protein PHACADRAFT_30137 [Phanerochaete carnosa HHB-10118-sp]|uniref:Uncharacterized protein n=1 Tax=Phanerochaete carnosa (strain HHB-10118-sp) TaxID=650164 RepID=K5VNJ8_PHACS|nr:uncharacterized protein PHACADRAFT_30137 [Phanerochaete carnosa HHB-10118-sp]EKM53043.1 hypothetical protein PHACADRAFT_30137 [Phanerochaete carnosa HHB-10118-sp]
MVANPGHNDSTRSRVDEQPKVGDVSHNDESCSDGNVGEPSDEAGCMQAAAETAIGVQEVSGQPAYISRPCPCAFDYFIRAVLSALILEMKDSYAVKPMKELVLYLEPRESRKGGGTDISTCIYLAYDVSYIDWLSSEPVPTVRHGRCGEGTLLNSLYRFCVTTHPAASLTSMMSSKSDASVPEGQSRSRSSEKYSSPTYFFGFVVASCGDGTVLRLLSS